MGYLKLYLSLLKDCRGTIEPIARGGEEKVVHTFPQGY